MLPPFIDCRRNTRAPSYCNIVQPPVYLLNSVLIAVYFKYKIQNNRVKSHPI